MSSSCLSFCWRERFKRRSLLKHCCLKKKRWSLFCHLPSNIYTLIASELLAKADLIERQCSSETVGVLRTRNAFEPLKTVEMLKNMLTIQVKTSTGTALAIDKEKC